MVAQEASCTLCKYPVGGGIRVDQRHLETERGAPDSTVACPLRTIVPPDQDGNQHFRYWSFATNDLYNWKFQNVPFSKNP